MTTDASPPSVEGQLALRSTRAQACWRERKDGSSTLVVGWPMSISRPTPSRDWSTFRHEAQSSLSYVLEQQGFEMALDEFPLPCEMLESWSPLGATSTAPMRLPSKTITPDVSIASQGPYVWAGLVQVPAWAKPSLQDLFFQVGPLASTLLSATNHRLEALLEEAGTQLRLFPLTAFWNSLSVARITYARMRLAELAANGTRWNEVRREGPYLAILDGQKELLRLRFPEETDEDVARLFTKRPGPAG